ncbi:MAG: TonB-dependent receptor [Bacteroidetes bacterium]|nr:MAG: TonB-dependent receptor [Bacteroidota bacterium]
MRRTAFIFSFSLSILIYHSSIAQLSTGKISGIIKDNTGKPIESVSVSLLKLKDSSLVKVAITNSGGQFEFERIAIGHYLISVSNVGYIAWWSNPQEISPAHQSIIINEITLQTAAASLGTVTVVGKRPLVENKIDKIVVNVEASISNAGNSALEVLEKSPNITIDKDGNINVKGKQGVVILIDGKQTYLGGQDLVELLKSMPASQLDQIEIMTQPSAKYDASGNSGIINIKTKRGQQKGFNGNISLSYVQAIYPKSPNSFNFNYRNNKFNVFGTYSYSYWKGFSDININRIFVDSIKGINQHLSQVSNLKFHSHPFNMRTGVDFYASPKTTFGIVVSGQLDYRTSQVHTLSNFFDLDQNGKLASYAEAWTTNKTPWRNLGLNFNFKREMKQKGAELTGDFDYILYDSKSQQESDNFNHNPDGSLDSTSGAINPYLLRGNLPSIIRIYTGKADYTHPLKNNAKFEAGWKSSFVQTDNDAQYSYLVNNVPVVDTTRSNHFLYRENVNALYANFSKQIKKWSVQAGLRMEQTHAKGNQVVKNQSFDTSYVQLFPTFYLSYALTDKNQLTFSYGRRIDRPNYQDMNPFQYFLDQYTYRQGNPNLRPQLSHNIELSYNYKGELNLTANYTIVNDVINDVLKQIDSTRITYQTKENVAKQTNVGLSLTYNKQLTKWVNVSLSGNLFRDHYTGFVNNSYLNVDLTAFNFNFNTQFTMGKGWSSEINGFYNSKNLYSGLIVAEPMEIISFAVAKKVLKDKGMIKLNFRDPFYIMHFSGYTQFGNINTTIHAKWDNRRVALVFTYRFGKTMNNTPARKKEGSAEEQNRVGGNGQQ